MLCPPITCRMPAMTRVCRRFSSWCATWSEGLAMRLSQGLIGARIPRAEASMVAPTRLPLPCLTRVRQLRCPCSLATCHWGLARPGSHLILPPKRQRWDAYDSQQVVSQTPRKHQGRFSPQRLEAFLSDQWQRSGLWSVSRTYSNHTLPFLLAIEDGLSLDASACPA